MFRLSASLAKYCQKSKKTEQGILIVPLWSTQQWFLMVINLITEPPLLIRARKNLLLLPWIPYAVHQLQKHLNLLAVSLSGKLAEIKKRTSLGAYPLFMERENKIPV